MNKTILLGILLLMVACSDTTTVKVGFIGPLSGDATIIGEENLRGIQVAIAEINSNGGIDGKQIELIVKDDQFVKKETLTQFQQLTQIEGVDFILTPTYGGFLALGSDSEAILVDSLDASEEFANLGENAFAVGIYDESLAYSIADYLNERGIREVGMILNTEDPFMTLTENAFMERFEGSFEKETYGFDSVDFRTTLTKMSKFDFIVVLGWEETGNIIRQAHELGMENQFIGIDTFASADFKQNAGGNLEGLLFTFWEGTDSNPVFVKLLSDYEAMFGEEPDNIPFAAIGHDAMAVLGSALRECSAEIECVKSSLRATENFPGATGLLTIDPGQITRDIEETMHTYKDGEIVPVD